MKYSWKYYPAVILGILAGIIIEMDGILPFILIAISLAFVISANLDTERAKNKKARNRNDINRHSHAA